MQAFPLSLSLILVVYGVIYLQAFYLSSCKILFLGFRPSQVLFINSDYCLCSLSCNSSLTVLRVVPVADRPRTIRCQSLCHYTHMACPTPSSSCFPSSMPQDLTPGDQHQLPFITDVHRIQQLVSFWNSDLFLRIIQTNNPEILSDTFKLYR